MDVQTIILIFVSFIVPEKIAKILFYETKNSPVQKNSLVSIKITGCLPDKRPNSANNLKWLRSSHK